jgi:hypothetical protein
MPRNTALTWCFSYIKSDFASGNDVFARFPMSELTMLATSDCID